MQPNPPRINVYEAARPVPTRPSPRLLLKFIVFSVFAQRYENNFNGI